jgi:hypothetical protein
MNSTGRNMMREVDAAESSSRAGLAGPSQLTKVAETKKEEEDDDMTTGIHEPEPVANPPPREELVTLNLIDKVGSSSSSERS